MGKLHIKFGFQFTHFDVKIENQVQSILEGWNVSDVGYLSIFLSGGFAGFAWWLLSYPQDTIIVVYKLKYFIHLPFY